MKWLKTLFRKEKFKNETTMDIPESVKQKAQQRKLDMLEATFNRNVGKKVPAIEFTTPEAKARYLQTSDLRFQNPNLTLAQYEKLLRDEVPDLNKQILQNMTNRKLGSLQHNVPPAHHTTNVTRGVGWSMMEDEDFLDWNDDEMDAQQKPAYTFFSLEEYVAMIKQNALIHQVSVLFDDRPEEISLRIEYVKNLHTLHESLLQSANQELSHITQNARVKDCKQLDIQYIQREVIGL